MIINWIGKTLVFVQLAVSIVCLVGGLIIFMDKTDWGWKEPRLYHKLRVASKLDKRIAGVRDVQTAVRAIRPNLAEAQKSIRDVELAFGRNHLYYEARLKQLTDDTTKLIDVEQIERDAEGNPKLSQPMIGMPLFQPHPELKQTKTIPTLRADVKKIDSDIAQVISQMPQWVDKMEGVAFLLTGKDAAGQEVQPGLYDLLQTELDKHERIEFEKDYLVPTLVDIEDEVDLYLDRRMRLERNLKQLESLGAQYGIK